VCTQLRREYRALRETPACPTLGLTQYNVNGTCDTTAGFVCSLTCRADLDLIGEASTFCQYDGTWTEIPDCTGIVNCPIYAAPAGYSIVGDCDNSFNTTCVLSCAVGYEGMGTSVTCMFDGNWTTIANLSEFCTELPPCPAVDLGEAYITDVCSNTSGTECGYSCAQGYQGFNSSAYCNSSGIWDLGSTCIAIPACPTYQLQNGYAFNGTCDDEVGSVCHLKCADGYSGLAMPVFCTSSLQWMETSGCTVVPSCPAVTVPVGYLLNATCSDMSSGALCAYHCSSKYKGDASSIVCLDGVWTTFSGCVESENKAVDDDSDTSDSAMSTEAVAVGGGLSLVVVGAVVVLMLNKKKSNTSGAKVHSAEMDNFII
jgi:hypothetical protein